MSDKHEDNVQRSIEEVLGRKIKLRKTKKTPEDKQKVLFSKIINSIAAAEEKTLQIEMLTGIDLINYNLPFQEAIEGLLELHFNPKQVNLIYWFMYDRVTIDGIPEQFVDEFNDIIPLDTPDDLYDFIKHIK